MPAASSRTATAAATHPVEDLVARWPENRPLVCLDWNRDGWSYVAEPVVAFRVDGGGTIPAASTLFDPGSGASRRPPVPLAGEPLSDLERIIAAWPQADSGRLFGGGWIGTLSYELGRLIEPRAQARRGEAPHHWPLLEFHFCPNGYVVDHATGEVWWQGDPGAQVALSPAARRRPAFISTGIAAADDLGAREEAYKDGVARILGHIGAGDVYQVNLAHRLAGSFSGSMRSAFLTLRSAARPWYGAYIELAPRSDDPGLRRALLSMSPELFLDIHADHGSTRITTRPMKGTRPAPPRGDPEELRHNPKDRAELNMIVDLMRNDLGRICQPGSVRVEEPRAIEQHGAGEMIRGGDSAGGVLQATATISGRLRPGTGLAEILRATFPPGSVTGAPKIRAMQIIDQLEPALRGPYCGAIGWVSVFRAGSEAGLRASLNVAIRTAIIEGRGRGARDRIDDGKLQYSVGAGIVADSTPDAEWQETLDKAGVLDVFKDRPIPGPGALEAR